MTKKDYELIAAILSGTRSANRESRHQGAGTRAAVSTCEHLACRFADELAPLNPQFDRARFLRACGVAE